MSRQRWAGYSVDRFIATFAALAVCMLWCFGTAAWAIPNNWTGDGDATHWSDPLNWSAGVPDDGHLVTINSGASVVLTNATYELASFAITDATLTFAGWDSALKATDMTIAGTLTHLAQSATDVDPISGEWEPDHRILLVGTTITVTSAGHLDADRLGYAAGCGPGYPAFSIVSYSGGGYGGKGGVGNRGVPGKTYGSPVAPADPGSGGGGTSQYPAGPGGGVIRVMASGLLHIATGAKLTANGGDGTSRGGGGSGGSVWLTAAEITGSGSVTADGGAGAGVSTFGAGGGGGRIALDTPQNYFSGIIRAQGKAGAREPGRSGTFNFSSDLDQDLVIVDDIALPPGANWVFRSLTVTDGATFEIQSVLGTPEENYTNEVASRVRFESDVTIAANATLSADGLGYPQLLGLGAGQYHSGAGYGGRGGMGRRESPGDGYGDPFAPEDLGSGGGAYPDYGGGCGGGALILDIGGKLTVNGTISANGTRSPARGGGGSGGSIWLTASEIMGAGVIAAHGGAGGDTGTYGAGGGGGRIALDIPQNNFTGTLRAQGRPGWAAPGRSGTFNFASDPDQDLVIVDDIALPPGTNWVFRSLTVTDGAIFEIQSISGTSAANWMDEIASRIRFERDVTIVAGATLSADGLGYLEDQGPGAGTIYSGGGYGGQGGQGISGVPGGIYGSALAPDRLGSGSGRVSATPPYAGAIGGGAMFVEVFGNLLIDGMITANGGDGQLRTSGASGGSVWLRAARIEGDGVVSANGGIRGSQTTYSACGGGGRIQVDIGWIDYFALRPSQLAVWENPETWPEPLEFTGDMTVDGGIRTGDAQDGSLSIRYLPIPTPGTILRIR